jgi:hypothetical protein
VTCADGSGRLVSKLYHQNHPRKRPLGNTALEHANDLAIGKSVLLQGEFPRMKSPGNFIVTAKARVPDVRRERVFASDALSQPKTSFKNAELFAHNWHAVHLPEIAMTSDIISDKLHCSRIDSSCRSIDGSNP